MRFSERYGYKEVRELVQLESMDEPLRNALWNLLKIHIWDYVHPSIMYREFYLSDVENAEVNNLCRRIWFSHFKFPLDNLVNDWNKVYAYLRGYFFESEWYEVYDFIEFVADNYERHGFGLLMELLQGLLSIKKFARLKTPWKKQSGRFRFIYAEHLSYSPIESSRIIETQSKSQYHPSRVW